MCVTIYEYMPMCMHTRWLLFWSLANVPAAASVGGWAGRGRWGPLPTLQLPTGETISENVHSPLAAPFLFHPRVFVVTFL